jgi:amino acid transporter
LSAAGPQKKLSLFDSVCIIVGIIVGAGIYETAPTIAQGVGSWNALVLIWAVGGVLSLAGALCYAELATTYPEEGGECVYLRRAYGRWAGFLFAWAQVLVIRPGSIAAMAFPFARYAQAITSDEPVPDGAQSTVLIACVAIVILTVINLVGLQGGKWTQNALTVVKLIALLALASAVFAVPLSEEAFTGMAEGGTAVGLALILVLFTFGGWNEIAYVAAEVKRPEKNLYRALVWGTVLVTVVYLLVNTTFTYVLGFPGFASSSAVATDTVGRVAPGIAARLVGAIICISTLGAVNGLIFTGARIYYALGVEYRGFGWLSGWDVRRSTPSIALVLQGAVSLAIVVWAGTFNQTVVYTTAVVWLFFLATGVSVMVLRSRDRAVERKQKVPWYPVTPLVFCASCLYLIYAAFDYDFRGAMVSLCVLLIGLFVYLLYSRKPRPHAATASASEGGDVLDRPDLP